MRVHSGQRDARAAALHGDTNPPVLGGQAGAMVPTRCDGARARAGLTAAAVGAIMIILLM